ncbi:MAG: hypothetical protein UZ12_BCD005001319 [Bacteroidetes bacterium OLB12]|nr:MAG: hypothetical protein UZ12_BCD005001319 [Bacteroidetes bacterium OLB12]
MSIVESVFNLRPCAFRNPANVIKIPSQFPALARLAGGTQYLKKLNASVYVSNEMLSWRCVETLSPSRETPWN